MSEKIEILCATMHQSDFGKCREMNISLDVLFANQTDRFGYETCEFDGHTVKMVSTPTRGVGKNRNIAITHSTGDILLFADDDMLYADDLESIVSGAFSELPRADVILFGTNYAKDGKIYKTRLPKTERLPKIKALKYGTYAIAVRRSALLGANLHFSELFGGGCRYSYGEDTDLIVQCYKKGLKIYSYHGIIGTTNKDTSTCFTGYGEKYYFDKGALAAHSLGCYAFPYMIKMSKKKLEPCTLGFGEKLRLMRVGYKSFATLTSYDEWKNGHEKDTDRK